jgi:hypothetical protein
MSHFFSSFFGGGDAPAPAPVPVAPTQDNSAALAAQRDAYAEEQRRARGRASTILAGKYSEGLSPTTASTTLLGK